VFACKFCKTRIFYVACEKDKKNVLQIVILEYQNFFFTRGVKCILVSRKFACEHEMSGCTYNFFWHFQHLKTCFREWMNYIHFGASSSSCSFDNWRWLAVSWLLKTRRLDSTRRPRLYRWNRRLDIYNFENEKASAVGVIPFPFGSWKAWQQFIGWVTASLGRNQRSQQVHHFCL
jgi:hypothetical protein